MAPQRRRERDRPKNEPNAPYNTTGRRILRYDSSSDEEKTSPAPPPPEPPVPRSPSPEKQQPATAAEGVDFTFQRPAFALDGADEDLQAYLRGVAAESAGMKQYTTTTTLPSGDFIACVHASTSWAPRNKSPPKAEHVQLLEPQIAYYQFLKAHFLRLRKRMKVLPIAAELQALGNEYPYELGAYGRTTITVWQKMLRSRPPLSVQIRAMDQASVNRGLNMIKVHHLRRGSNIHPTACAWIWSLLAKLDNVGLMDSDRVARIRELAKKAIVVQVSFDNPEAAQQLDESEAWDDGDFESIGDAPVLATNKDESITDETRAALDMIITICGDIYGQRDLLVARKVWKKEELEQADDMDGEVKQEADVSMKDASDVGSGDV